VLRRPLEPGQYTSIRYSDRLAEEAIAASIGSVGDSYDNAMAEALNGTFKAELVTLHGPWKTRRQLEIVIIEWIDWYNASRLHREIGSRPSSTRLTGPFSKPRPVWPDPNNPHCTDPGVAQSARWTPSGSRP
jgi:transposase InsO family protein